MKIKIMSKRAIEKYMQVPTKEKTAVISITDFGCDYATLKNMPEYLCRVAFDDVDNDVMADELGKDATEEEIKKIEVKYNMFSDEQANAVAEFYFEVCDKVDCLICQCEHGQSRSAAVAAAILEFKSRKGINVFSDDRYYPNKVVFRKVLKALRECVSSKY